MKSRNNWVSTPTTEFANRDEMIQLAKDRFDIQRYQSAEGEDVVVVNDYYNYDYESKSRVVIQSHNNPYNENREDRKIFFDYDTDVKRGSYIIWEDKWWLTLTKVEGNHAYRHATISECNNILKWHDKFGKLHTFPCIFYPQSKANSFDFNQTINTVNALCKIEVQYNEYTNLINVDDRFILNGLAYTVSSINKHKMNDCFDTNSVSTIVFDLSVCQVQDDDDLVNNVANTKKYAYVLQISEGDFECVIGSVGKLSYNITLDGRNVDIPVEFKSSDEAIIKVLDDGTYDAIGSGSATITCNIKGNDNIFDSIQIDVGAVVSNVVSIRLTSSEVKILQGESSTYEVAKYANEVKTSDTIHIEDVSDADKSCYNIVINTNSFTIKNNKRSSKKVKVRCYDDFGNSEVFVFTLGGAF